MVPALSFLAKVLAGLITAAGLDQLTKHGYMPQATYIKAALKALEKDDLDEAIRNYKLSVKKWRPSQRSEVTAEIISSAISLRLAKLESRLAELQAILHPPWYSLQYWRNLLPKNRDRLEQLRQEQEGFAEAIRVLQRLQAKLEENDKVPQGD